MPIGGKPQPTATCLLIVCVKVETGLPVATGLAVTPFSFAKPRTIKLVEDPRVENATDLPAASLNVFIGESAGTYQYSYEPDIEAPITRMGAPFAKAPEVLNVPMPTPISAA